MSSESTPSGAGEARPVRVQRRRARGWRMPVGAVYVGRPSRWGNPYPLTEHRPADAVALYRSWLLDHPDLLATARTELAGRSLACWCPPGAPCHADVLLDLANLPGRRVGPGAQSPAPPTPTTTSTLPRAAATAGRATDTPGAPS